MNAFRGQLANGLTALTALALLAALLLTGPAQSGPRPPAPPPSGILPGSALLPVVAAAPRRIALTFDDYPFPGATPRLLEALARQNVRATFFCVGDKLETHPEFAAQALYLGHELENHTYNHRRLTTCTPRQINRELRLCSRVVQGLTGRRPRFLRSPGGRSTPVIRREAADCGLFCVDPLVSNIGDMTRTEQEIMSRCLREARDGAVFSLHDGMPETMGALARVVPLLRARGYEFVTLDELLPPT